MSRRFSKADGVRRAWTPTMKRLAERIGGAPSSVQIGRQLGLLRQQVERVLYEERCTPHIQEALAKWAGMKLVDLFGDAAWPRVAGRKLREMLAAKRLLANRRAS